MSKNSNKQNGKKQVRNEITDVFAKYEPHEEAPELPRIDEAPLKKKRTSERIARRLEVPAPSMVSTGISGLDDALEGGIPDHSLFLVSGETGSHYETFTNQIIYNHLANNGKVAYYLAETLTTDVQQDMERYGWSLKEYIDKESCVFVNLRTPDLQQLAKLAPKVFNEGFSVPLTTGLNGLKTDILERIKEDRWTVMELSHILHNYSLNEVMSLILYWKAAARIYGGIHLILLPQGIHADNVLNALKHLTDGVLEFHLREGPRQYETVMTASKIRTLRRPRKIIFTVEEDGILIETAARIA